MKFGLHLGMRGPAAAPDSLIAIATLAEALGFEHLGFSDHVVIATEVASVYPYTKTGRWFAADTGTCLEQVTVMSFVAAATRRIRLLNSVMVLPHRPVMLAAKMLTTVDVLSKGRLTVGVGVGWMAEELVLLGAPAFARRGRASDEYIRAFRELWTAERPRFTGEFVNFDGVMFEPKPVQRPHPPIWVGGESAVARRRAARLGDGWYPLTNNPAAPYDTPDLFAAGVTDMRRAAEAAGRDPAGIEIALFAMGCRIGAPGEGRDGGRLAFTGSAQAIVDDIGAYARRGVRQLVIGFENNELQATLDRLDQFAEAVMTRAA
ncbi:MAG: TIGR03619 family F420-dependent LLM class oxidoreductase [Alphaproteobacteria bacterium]|nr:TIGR03619 family F420-dependent LLM class oxidoreductase [Alphaproteobacteria bacterium]